MCKLFLANMFSINDHLLSINDTLYIQMCLMFPRPHGLNKYIILGLDNGLQSTVLTLTGHFKAV